MRAIVPPPTESNRPETPEEAAARDAFRRSAANENERESAAEAFDRRTSTSSNGFPNHRSIVEGFRRAHAAIARGSHPDDPFKHYEYGFGDGFNAGVAARNANRDSPGDNGDGGPSESSSSGTYGTSRSASTSAARVGDFSSEPTSGAIGDSRTPPGDRRWWHHRAWDGRLDNAYDNDNTSGQGR